MAADIGQPQFVYRIAAQDEWAQAQERGEYAGGDFDQQSGFIHLSTIEQVPGTLKLFFAGRGDLVLLKISATQLGTGLKYDVVPELGTFPHFYGTGGKIGPIPISAIVESSVIKLENGTHVVPFL